VFPRNSNLPTIEQVVELSTRYLHKYIAKVGTPLLPTVKFEIRNNNHTIVSTKPDQSFSWNDNEYGWFTINHVPGGCDAYFEYLDDMRKEIWEEEIAASTARCSDFADIIRASLEIGHYWRFRRSAGQLGVVSLYYGLLASAVAELTNGFVYSDDGAWDLKYFPILPDEFRNIFFQPDKTSDQEWVERCISAIPDELKKYGKDRNKKNFAHRKTKNKFTYPTFITLAKAKLRRKIIDIQSLTSNILMVLTECVFSVSFNL
jgi:hypothetical protein